MCHIDCGKCHCCSCHSTPKKRATFSYRVYVRNPHHLTMFAQSFRGKYAKRNAMRLVGDLRSKLGKEWKVFARQRKVEVKVYSFECYGTAPTVVNTKRADRKGLKANPALAVRKTKLSPRKS